jgi:hypothetical protein
MYANITHIISITDWSERVEVDHDDLGRIHLHLPEVYLSFQPDEWDALVIEVARLRGLTSEHPFTGDTLVSIPGDPLTGPNYGGQQPEEAT